MVKKSDYIKKLIMMQKLEPRAVGLQLTKIRHEDRISVCTHAPTDEVTALDTDIQQSKHCYNFLDNL